MATMRVVVRQMKTAQIPKPGAGFQIVEREVPDPVEGQLRIGWHGGHDHTCRECRRGDFRNCRNLKIPGISYDGG